MKQEIETRLMTIQMSLYYLNQDLIHFSEPFSEEYAPWKAKATEKEIKRLEKEHQQLIQKVNWF